MDVWEKCVMEVPHQQAVHWSSVDPEDTAGLSRIQQDQEDRASYASGDLVLCRYLTDRQSE